MTNRIIQRFSDEAEPGDALAVRMKGINSETCEPRPDVIYSGRVLRCSDTVYPSDVTPIYGFRATYRHEVTGDGLKTEHIGRWTHIGACRGSLGVLDWSRGKFPPDHDPEIVLMSSTTIVEFVAGQIVRADQLLTDDDPAVSAKFVDADARTHGGQR